MINKKLLLTYADGLGFPVIRFTTSRHLSAVCRHYERVKGYEVSRIIKQWIPSMGYDLINPGVSVSFLVCGLSTFRHNDRIIEEQKGPSGIFAPFARRNYYAEAVSRLKKLALWIREQTNLKKQDVRIFCNSRAPEKFLAWASGLGLYGKNSLIINNILGSSFIIAGISFPLDIEGAGEMEIPGPPGILCGECTLCIDNCPTRGIITPGIIDSARCIQGLSTSLRIFPDRVKQLFQDRIYGCRVCQDVCPYNKGLTLETETKQGELGPSIPLILLLQKTPEELRLLLKKTVPGSSWIDMRALQRNGILAAGNCGDPALVPFITPFLDSPHPALADAAHWAIQCLTSSVIL